MWVVAVVVIKMRGRPVLPPSGGEATHSETDEHDASCNLPLPSWLLALHRVWPPLGPWVIAPFHLVHRFDGIPLPLTCGAWM